jgi:hypothetical protein
MAIKAKPAAVAAAREPCASQRAHTVHRPVVRIPTGMRSERRVSWVAPAPATISTRLHSTASNGSLLADGLTFVYLRVPLEPRPVQAR